MRYWIWWNDLVQGPFEISELTTLQAFSEELQVCLEGRVDWLPASRVADLAPAIEALRSRQSGVIAPSTLPPPPPPAHPPVLEPLQGHFFADPPGQKLLFDPPGENKGPFAYAPAGEEPELGIDAGAIQVTMPIRFGGLLTVGGENVVRVAPAPVQPGRTEIQLLPLPRPEPVQKTLPEPSVPELFPERDSIAEPETVLESDVPEIIELPRPLQPPSLVLRESPIPEESQFISTKPDDPQIEVPLKVVPEQSMPAVSAAPAEDVPGRFVLPRMGSWEKSDELSRRSWKWLPWTLGAAAMAALLLFGVYALMDYFTSREAISAVAKMNLPTVPVQTAQPAIPKPHPAAVPVHNQVLPKPKLKPKPTPTPKPKPIPTKKTVQSRPLAIPQPAVKPVKKMIAPAPRMSDVEAALPDVSVQSPPKQAPAVTVPASPPAAKPVAKPAPDLFANRQSDAIAQVMKFRIADGKSTIGGQAKTMLEAMHDKELLHAAETGERLYLPDKLSWAALREGGPLYRAYLNYSALQANGDRVQTRSYQFAVDLKALTVTTDDNATRQDFLAVTQNSAYDRQVMAKDIDNILSGVDDLNKQKLRAMVVRKSRKNASEIKSIEAATKHATEKVRKAIVYFRTRYPEKALQNVAKAYAFGELLK